MKGITRHLALLVPAAMLAVAVPALAQDGAPPPPPPGGPAWGGATGPADMAGFERQREDDIALLIGLRPDQRPAFDAMMRSLADALHPGGGEHRLGMGGWGMARGGAQDGAPMTFGRRLDAMAAMLDQHDDKGKQAIEAARRFYASLDPAQRARFDALDRLHADRMRIDRGMHRHAGEPPRE